MKLHFANERVLAVVAHPDDAELLCAGTLARAKAGGAAIGICVLCQGDKGQPAKPIKNLAAVRRREMQAAARLLGAELFHGGFPDGGLADETSQRRKLVEILRQFRPTLVLAHAVEDYHPDHQAASRLAEAASWFCASRAHRTKSPALPTPPALWWMDTIEMHRFTPGFFVDVSAFAGLKEKMLACHRSQLARGADGDFSPLLDLMRLQSRARGAQSGVAAAEAFRQHFAFKRTRAW
ncbi:MAG: PIG-L family deacetylase [Verrucomicrobia bacterium]|nr:PIG-L family deacetylase [Verrucomicrobiota bacterium]